MTHPGLPEWWAYIVYFFMILVGVFYTTNKHLNSESITSSPIYKSSFLKFATRFFLKYEITRIFFKIVVLLLFGLIIFSGLNGTSIPERNIATVLTWNIWWAGLIISVFFLGSMWCAVCPWDTLATWLVKPRLWFGFKINNSLELTPPKWMRNVWPALFMFVGLTWLELGVGVTTSPYWTALLSLLMVVLATISLAVFKNKAFCHYVCPVGRTIGFYSQLAPVELRPIDADKCVSCISLDCFNGNDKVDACPTQLVMGSLTQNTYCTSCGNCVQSCPEENISLRLRPQSNEAMHSARPRWDETWFMLILLALTSFHGITMMGFWESSMSQFAQKIGDSGQLLVSFSVGLLISIAVLVLMYSVAIVLTRHLSDKTVSFRKVFSTLVFATLPLSFCYHLAHNLNHMIRESVGASQLFYNPLGVGMLPKGFEENILKEYNMIISQDVLFALQAGLMMFGFWIAMKVLAHRGGRLLSGSGLKLVPMLTFLWLVNGFHLWMLTQPMVMRVGAMCVAQ